MLQLARGKLHSQFSERRLVVIGATQGLAVVIDLLEKRCDLFSVSA